MVSTLHIAHNFTPSARYQSFSGKRATPFLNGKAEYRELEALQSLEGARGMSSEEGYFPEFKSTEILRGECCDDLNCYSTWVGESQEDPKSKGSS